MKNKIKKAQAGSKRHRLEACATVFSGSAGFQPATITIMSLRGDPLIHRIWSANNEE
jgi:hypothetical protein